MSGPKQTPFPILSRTTESLALLEFIRIKSAQALQEMVPLDHSQRSAKPYFLLMNLELLTIDYDAYWLIFQKASEDYTRLSGTWNSNCKSPDTDEAQRYADEIAKNWGPEIKGFHHLQIIAKLCKDQADKDPTWQPLSIIIWAIVTSLLEPKTYDLLMEHIINTVDQAVSKVSYLESKAQLN